LKDTLDATGEVMMSLAGAGRGVEDLDGEE